jgi:hypothetical protein
MALVKCRSGETGRRTGLKIPRGQPHVGSIPTSGTRKIRGLANVILLSPFLVVLSERHSVGQVPRTHRSKNRQRDIKWDVEASGK